MPRCSFQERSSCIYQIEEARAVLSFTWMNFQFSRYFCRFKMHRLRALTQHKRQVKYLTFSVSFSHQHFLCYSFDLPTYQNCCLTVRKLRSCVSGLQFLWIEVCFEFKILEFYFLFNIYLHREAQCIITASQEY